MAKRVQVDKIERRDGDGKDRGAISVHVNLRNTSILLLIVVTVTATILTYFYCPACLPLSVLNCSVCLEFLISMTESTDCGHGSKEADRRTLTICHLPSII